MSGTIYNYIHLLNKPVVRLTDDDDDDDEVSLDLPFVDVGTAVLYFDL